MLKNPTIVSFNTSVPKRQVSLAWMGLYKAAWGQMMLRYICVLICYCKQLDICFYTACQGIYINIQTLFKSILEYLVYTLF